MAAENLGSQGKGRDGEGGAPGGRGCDFPCGGGGVLSKEPGASLACNTYSGSSMGSRLIHLISLAILSLSGFWQA